MATNEKIVTGDTEGSKIEREKKYIIDDEKTANVLSSNLPDELIIPFPEDADQGQQDLLVEIIPQLKENGSFILKKISEKEKHRPNLYFDTNEEDLKKKNISINIRERNDDWSMTLKIRPRSQVSDLLERIEINGDIPNAVMNKAKSSTDVDIHYIFNRRSYLKAAYDKYIKTIINGRSLKVANYYTVNSTSADYLFNRDGKIIISVDRIIPHEKSSQHLYEMEIEIRFGSNSKWLDTISMRVFDYFCTVVLETLKEHSRSQLEEEKLNVLFNKTTTLSKLERVRQLPETEEILPQPGLGEDILFTSLKGKGHAISFLIQFLTKIFSLPAIKSNLPISVCSYLVSFTNTYPDVKPFTKEESNMDTQEFKDYILRQAQSKFDQALMESTLNPDSVFDLGSVKDYDPKVLILKLTESSYLCLFLFLIKELPLKIEELDNMNLRLYDYAGKMLKALFDQTNNELTDRKIEHDIQIDCALLYEKINIKSAKQESKINNISLIQSDANISNMIEELKNRLLNTESRLNQLINSRSFLREIGEREPGVIIGDEWKNYLFMNLYTNETITLE